MARRRSSHPPVPGKDTEGHQPAGIDDGMPEGHPLPVLECFHDEGPRPLAPEGLGNPPAAIPIREGPFETPSLFRGRFTHPLMRRKRIRPGHAPFPAFTPCGSIGRGQLLDLSHEFIFQ
jgi:hypothetical protein